MKVIVTGGAGFIGSNLVDRLCEQGNDVVVIDDFSTGQHRFLEGTRADVHALDLTDPGADLLGVMEGAQTVFHLAANADVRFGWSDTRRDLKYNVEATMRLAEAANEAGVQDFVFTSTGAVYGESAVFPTPEDASFPVQTSLYGASKASAEGFLSAFAARDAFRVTVLRFVSVLGPRYMHGHVIDFVRQLARTPDKLTVLGNGRQRKSYMHVSDCVDGLVSLRANGNFEVFNLGRDEYCTVLDSVGWICSRMGLDPMVTVGDSDRGWVGDNPFTYLDVRRAQSRGWNPQVPIRESVEATVDWLLANPWALAVDDRRR